MSQSMDRFQPPGLADEQAACADCGNRVPGESLDGELGLCASCAGWLAERFGSGDNAGTGGDGDGDSASEPTKMKGTDRCNSEQ